MGRDFGHGGGGGVTEVSSYGITKMGSWLNYLDNVRLAQKARLEDHKKPGLKITFSNRRIFHLFKIKIDYPTQSEELEILKRYKNEIKVPSMESITGVFNAKELAEIQSIVSQVRIEDQILHYISQITTKTRNHAKLYLGGSPRASLSMLKASKAFAAIRGRDFVIPDDVNGFDQNKSAGFDGGKTSNLKWSSEVPIFSDFRLATHFENFCTRYIEGHFRSGNVILSDGQEFLLTQHLLSKCFSNEERTALCATKFLNQEDAKTFRLRPQLTTW